MTRLEAHISDRLARVGVAADTRPFRPHVTIARIRDTAGLRARPVIAGLTDASLGVVTVSGYTLFESRTASAGVEYIPIVRSRLVCEAVS
jgi:2'-5' RNA ligase